MLTILVCIAGLFFIKIQIPGSASGLLRWKGLFCLRSHPKGPDFLKIKIAKVDQAEGKGEQLREWESPPNRVQAAEAGEQVCGGKQYDQLPHCGDGQAQKAVPQGLADGEHADAEARENEAEADRPKRRHADLLHCLRGVENGEQLVRNQPKDQDTDEHDDGRIKNTQLDRLHHTVRLACTVVIGDDRHHAVVEAEDRHENKALQLKIDAEDGGGGRSEGDQDFIHAKGHYGADGGHDDRWDADGVDLPNHFSTGPEALEAKGDFIIFFDIEDECED